MRLHCGVLGTIIVALCFECRQSLLLRVAELEAKLLPGFARCARLFAKLMGATGLGDSLSRFPQILLCRACMLLKMVKHRERL